MVKHLTRVGNSLALVIDRPILDLLQLDADTPLEIVTDGRSLTISPVGDADREANRQRQFTAALAWTNKRYAKTLKRLSE